MRKLIAICALLLSASAAQAQTDKAPAVTKLPGEEKLSVRERAERDFLMPVRHKKMAEAAKTIAQVDQDATASPELDATAHYTEAPEARPEEVATVERATAVHHYSRARRHSRSTATTRSSRASAHRSTKKAAAHKTKTKTKKATATKSHRATKKTVSKASSHKKRRR